MGSIFLKVAPVMIWVSDTFPQSAGLYQVIECDATCSITFYHELGN